jgi:hypothetical protein
VQPDDYLTASDELLSQADRFGDPEHAAASRAEAQVKAIQAVAAAIDRLAVAVEASR